MKPYIYTCATCGHTWNSDDENESFCPCCEGIYIEIEDCHAD